MNSIRLYDYQYEMLERIVNAFKEHRSVMMQMPTGTGKTHVLAAVVKDFIDKTEGTVWIVAHRRELVSQIDRTLERKEFFGGGRADKKNKKQREAIKAFSIQWLSRHWQEIKGQPALIVIDEAHHAKARTYSTLWEKFPKARFLGLTATPCRMDRRGFTDLFDTLITSWSIAEFIEKGYLSVFDYAAIRQDGEEQRMIDSLQKRGADGDYQISEMDRMLNRHASIERLYRSVEKFARGKKGIVYAISISHARAIAEYYNRQGIKAVAIDSHTPANVRNEYIERFRDSCIDVLVNVDIFSEGFDCPDVGFVQMARPTLSLAKYLQQAGRGLRKTEDKETCIMIDNVGLCHVFGLPTVEWDWEAIFRGLAAGKGNTARQARKESIISKTPMEKTSTECDMEMIVEHEKLLSDIEKWSDSRHRLTHRVNELKAWRDEKSGLWGLKRGKTYITKALFMSVLDIRYDMATVRLSDKRCAIVGDDGRLLWKTNDCKSMKFTRNHLLHIVSCNKNEYYIDLYNFHIYNTKPEVKRYGNIELLKIDRTYHSRTKDVYTTTQDIHEPLIYKKAFYLAIYDGKMPFPSYNKENLPREHWHGFACLLEGDFDGYYWIYRKLEDGSIIIADKDGKYYLASEGKPKEYIGSCHSVEERSKCYTNIERLAKAAQEKLHAQKEKKAEKRLLALEQSDNVTPFQSGMRWGLKVGNRVTIPPVYRNIKSPVGKYCAVEKNYSQWGVVTLDGTLVVEPQYSDIEINKYGIVRGTKVTGNIEQMQLP